MSLLKNIILNSWVVESEDEDDKENTQSHNGSSQKTYEVKTQISMDDRKFIKDNIFKCIDMFVTTNKKISSELEHIIYNIAENDIETGEWPQFME